MTTAELRKIVKNTLIAQKGKFYGFNFTNILNAYNVSGTEVQNAISYFKFSPQQANFRKEIGLEA